MRRISAHYVLPVSSPPLKHGIVVLDETGTVRDLIDTGGRLRETAKLEFYNGVITPGFILPCLQYNPSATEVPVIQNPSIQNDGSFTRLDSWLRRSGVRGVGLIQRAGTHFGEKQKSPVHYHTIIELCPEKDDEFTAYQEAIDAITHAWNEHGQACSVSCCPKSWIDSDLLRYILEYISTHQSILTLTPDPGVAPGDPVRALNRVWEQLKEDAADGPPPIPGHLLICDDSLSGEQITVAGLKTYRFPLFREPRNENRHSTRMQDSNRIIDGNTHILGELYKIQEGWPGAGLAEILPAYTTEAARALFEEDRLGCIQPGSKPGLNLIGSVEYTRGGEIRLTKDSSLKVLQL